MAIIDGSFSIATSTTSATTSADVAFGRRCLHGYIKNTDASISITIYMNTSTADDATKAQVLEAGEAFTWAIGITEFSSGRGFSGFRHKSASGTPGIKYMAHE